MPRHREGMARLTDDERQVAYCLALLDLACCVAIRPRFLEQDPAYWLIGTMQVAVFVASLGCCIEVAAARSRAPVLFVLVLAALVGIIMHAAYYNKIGLVMSADGNQFYPAWRDALHFRVVSFTTLGYGDMAPREEYRLVAAFQAIYGYLPLGALAGMAVALFNRR